MLRVEAIQEEQYSEKMVPRRASKVPLFRPNEAVVPIMLESSIYYAHAMVETHRRLFAHSKAEYVSRCGGTLMFVSSNSPLSQLMSFGISEPVSAEDIEFVREYFGSRQAELRFRLTPFTHPSLHNALASVPTVFEGTGFQVFRPLKQDYKPGPSNIETRPIESAEQWRELFVEAFYDGNSSTDNEELALTIFNCPKTVVVGAWIDGRLAGGGAVNVRVELASLNAACTLPEYRGRGVQRALIKARLGIAARHNCQLAMSSVTPASESLRNHLREGFEIAYPTTVFRVIK